MGNIVNGGASNIDNNLPTPPLQNFTKDEIELIKKTWQIPCANTYDSAEAIFYTYLKRYPHNQAKFQAFRGIPLEELKGTPGFRAHASRIYNVFSSVIDSLDKDPEMKGIQKIVADAGKFHAKKRVTKKSYNELRVVLVEILSDVCQLNDEGKTVWSKLLDIFFHIMFECIDGRSDQFYKKDKQLI